MRDKRILVLVGSSIANLNTLSTLLSGDLNIVGAVVANQKKSGINLRFLKRAIQKQGLIKVIFQIKERIVYKFLNSRKDKKIHEKIFDRAHIEANIQQFRNNIRETYAYDDAETLEWIRGKNPDIIVIHTPYWVSKKVRDIVQGNVIGGHPGITQYYRGVHSPFWAIYNQDEKHIGFTIFWVDAGVDSGDIIFQGKISPKKEDSYLTLSWKGMKLIAENIVDILKNTDQIENIPRVKNNSLSERTIYHHPTIWNYLRYRFIGNYR